MCAVPGGDDTGALAAGPGREMLEVEIPAGGARIFRVDVQVRVEAHPGHASFAPSRAAAAGESGASARQDAIRRQAKERLWTSCACAPSATLPSCWPIPTGIDGYVIRITSAAVARHYPAEPCAVRAAPGPREKSDAVRGGEADPQGVRRRRCLRRARRGDASASVAGARGDLTCLHPL